MITLIVNMENLTNMHTCALCTRQHVLITCLTQITTTRWQNKQIKGRKMRPIMMQYQLRGSSSSVPCVGRFPALCAVGPVPRKEPPCLLFWPAGILVSAAGFCPRWQNTQEWVKVSTQVEERQNLLFFRHLYTTNLLLSLKRNQKEVIFVVN